jgi:WhiB family redox-sensing transcriptional regulator
VTRAGTDPEELNWQFDAACRGANADLFFPSADEDDSAAVAICRGCQVRLACLSFALERGERYGIWGGTNEKERARMTPEERERVLAAAREAA